MQFKFVYAGRLDQEKGIEDIVFAVRKILEEQQFDIEVDIFGQYGNCGGIVEELVQIYPHVLRYHGRQPKATIIPYWKASHFLLMPSHFLETFGLTCLDSYAFGKPVIGYQKGGLKELILDDYAIAPSLTTSSGEQLYSTMVDSMKQFDQQLYNQQSEQCSSIFRNYSKEVWKQKFSQISQNLGFSTTPNILLVSDYISRLGGIETFLYEAKDQLRSMGSFVTMKGSQISSSRGRIGGLLYSARNITFGSYLAFIIQQKSYDILRFHSVQRYCGWFPIWISSFFTIKKLFMLHDVGLLHPYPHLVTEEIQLQYDWNFINYLQAGYQVGKGGVFATLAMTAKFVSTQMIRFCLQQSIDCYLVPSSYLVLHLSRWLGSRKKYNIVVLDHFVDIDNSK